MKRRRPDAFCVFDESLAGSPIRDAALKAARGLRMTKGCKRGLGQPERGKHILAQNLAGMHGIK